MGDLTVSVRQLLKTPGFTVAAIVVLALGIALNAAMFAVVHALVFASRPFAEPDHLVQLYSRDSRVTRGYRVFSYPVYQELAARTDLFDAVLAHSATIVGVGEGSESRRALSAVVSREYFETLGVGLAHGRGFTAEESRPGQDIPVVIATHAYWKRSGLDPALVGKTVRINERPFTIIGITPEGFTGTMTMVGPELFLPLGVFDSLSNDFLGESARRLGQPDAFNLFLVARLARDVSITEAAQALALFGQSLARSFPAQYEHYQLSLAPLPRFGTNTSPTDESVVTTLGVVLLGMTAAVMLTVCLNLASMLSARGRARRREFAIRLALGGGRRRIVRQLLVEGMLLTMAGGIIGVALGGLGIDALLSAIIRLLPVTIVLEGNTLPALAGAALVVCVLATLAFALGPALKHARADIVSDLKVQTGDEPAPRGWRFVPRNPLVAGQLALSLGLLIAAGLFFRMALAAASVDLGFRADGTVLAEVDSRLGGLDEAQSLDVYARIEERLSALPGVQSASVGALVPLGLVSISHSVQRAGIAVPPGGTPATPEEGRSFSAPWNAVGGAYFDAMGIRLLQGRPFTSGEAYYGRGAPLVAILDENLARRLWPGGNALGQQVQFAPGDSTQPASPPMAVVGVVAATRRELFEREPRGAIYVPFAQGFQSNVFFHVRPARATGGLVAAVRREIRAVAPAVPLFGVRTFEAHVAGSPEYWALTMSMSMFGLFGGLAMVIALVGISGVTAYSVARRTREIGVRMAIGARPAAVLRLILGESAGTAIAGIALGWLLGLGVGQVMASIFVDLSAFDPVTFAIVPVGFAMAVLAATWLPARRATAVNPVAALRAE